MILALASAANSPIVIVYEPASVILICASFAASDATPSNVLLASSNLPAPQLTVQSASALIFHSSSAANSTVALNAVLSAFAVNETSVFQPDAAKLPMTPYVCSAAFHSLTSSYPSTSLVISLSLKK